MVANKNQGPEKLKRPPKPVTGPTSPSVPPDSVSTQTEASTVRKVIPSNSDVKVSVVIVPVVVPDTSVNRPPLPTRYEENQQSTADFIDKYSTPGRPVVGLPDGSTFYDPNDVIDTTLNDETPEPSQVSDGSDDESIDEPIIPLVVARAVTRVDAPKVPKGNPTGAFIPPSTLKAGERNVRIAFEATYQGYKAIGFQAFDTDRKPVPCTALIDSNGYIHTLTVNGYSVGKVSPYESLLICTTGYTDFVVNEHKIHVGSFLFSDELSRHLKETQSKRTGGQTTIGVSPNDSNLKKIFFVKDSTYLDAESLDKIQIKQKKFEDELQALVPSRDGNSIDGIKLPQVVPYFILEGWRKEVRSKERRAKAELSFFTNLARTIDQRIKIDSNTVKSLKTPPTDPT